MKIKYQRKDGVVQTYNVNPVWHGNINQLTEQNNSFRKVLFTGNEQLVLMSINVGQELGNEVHKHNDQFFRIEKGILKFVINRKRSFIAKQDEAVIIPKGTYHNVINVGNVDAKLYTIYAPSHHPPKTIDRTRADEIRREK